MQRTFFQLKEFKSLNRTEHGGSVLTGRRKERRPLDVKKPVHLVFRSERARESWSFATSTNRRRVNHLLTLCARRHDVRIYRFANSGNHLHLLVKAKNNEQLRAFLRAFSGLTARAITGAKKGFAVGKFWSGLVYSRLVSWGREFLTVRSYIIQNQLEELGILAWQPRGQAGQPKDIRKRITDST